MAGRDARGDVGFHVHGQGAGRREERGLGGGGRDHDVGAKDGAEAGAWERLEQPLRPSQIRAPPPRWGRGDHIGHHPVAGFQPLGQGPAEADADDPHGPGADRFDLGLQPRSIAAAGDRDDAVCGQDPGLAPEPRRCDQVTLGHRRE